MLKNCPVFFCGCGEQKADSSDSDSIAEHALASTPRSPAQQKHPTPQLSKHTALPSSSTSCLSLGCLETFEFFFFVVVQEKHQRKQATGFYTTRSSVPHFFHCSLPATGACGTQGTAGKPGRPETSQGDAHLPASSTPRPQAQHLPRTTSAVEKTLKISQLQTWSHKNKTGIPDGLLSGSHGRPRGSPGPSTNHRFLLFRNVASGPSLQYVVSSGLCGCASLRRC